MRCVVRVLALLSASASGLRQLELITEEGKEAIEGGPKRLQCLACLAVMEDIQIAMDGPIQKVDEGLTNLEEYRAKKGGKRLSEADKARRNEVNTELYVQQVLDPRRCQESMKEYDLAHVQGMNMFVRKREGQNLPIHMELNEVAKFELHQFCESFMEEFEEDLTELILADKTNLTERTCKTKLNLCEPPPKAKKAKKKKKDEAEMKKAKDVFDSMDGDKNGFVTRNEAHAHVEALAEDKKGTSMTEAQVDEFFDHTDVNADGKMTFNEYKKLWVKPDMHSFTLAGKTFAIPKDQKWRILAAAAVVFIFVPATSYMLELPMVWAAATLLATVGVSVGAFVLSAWYRAQ